MVFDNTIANMKMAVASGSVVTYPPDPLAGTIAIVNAEDHEPIAGMLRAAPGKVRTFFRLWAGRSKHRLDNVEIIDILARSLSRVARHGLH